MVQFTVPDMTCSGCAKAVTGAIQRIDPKAAVTIDLDTKKVSVASTAVADSLMEAVRDAGFTAEAA